MSVQEKILEVADQLFHKFGARSVSMDDIASELSISKKTIYQYFKDKNDIVMKVTIKAIQEEIKMFQEVIDVSNDAIEELFNLSKCLRKNMAEINPSLLFDLQKFHPKAWDLWLEFKNGFIKQSILDVIARGKNEGYFREDINAEIIAVFRVESVEMPFNSQIFPPSQFNFAEVQMALFDHFVHGLLTVKGQEIYDSLINSKTYAD